MVGFYSASECGMILDLHTAATVNSGVGHTIFLSLAKQIDEIATA